jgi:hypothetical protein
MRCITACTSGPLARLSWIARSAIRYSSCAATSSGLYTAMSGWPRATGCPVVFT